MDINKNKKDLFDSTNACHKEIWNMLVKNDISAFANGRWSDVENDFEEVFIDPDSTKADIIRVIKKYVPDFEHIETGKHLDQKM